jgi:signal peptidase
MSHPVGDRERRHRRAPLGHRLGASRRRPRSSPAGRRAFSVDLVWLALVVLVLGLAIGQRAAPLVGYELVVVRGSSMSPAIPVGALIAVRGADVGEVRPGQVVTIRADNGVQVTHRVVRLTEAGTETYLEMRGDANASPDPTLVPGRAVVGIVDWHLPWLGYVVGFLSMPSGILSVLAALACLYLATLLLEPIETPRRTHTDIGDAAPA